MSAGSMWPEQEAVEEWWAKHRQELKEAVTAYRLKIQGHHTSEPPGISVPPTAQFTAGLTPREIVWKGMQIALRHGAACECRGCVDTYERLALPPTRAAPSDRNGTVSTTPVGGIATTSGAESEGTPGDGPVSSGDAAGASNRAPSDVPVAMRVRLLVSCPTQNKGFCPAGVEGVIRDFDADKKYQRVWVGNSDMMLREGEYEEIGYAESPDQNQMAPGRHPEAQIGGSSDFRAEASAGAPSPSGTPSAAPSDVPVQPVAQFDSKSAVVSGVCGRLNDTGWVVDARVAALVGDVVNAIVAEMRLAKDDPNEARWAWLDEAADWLAETGVFGTPRDTKEPEPYGFAVEWWMAAHNGIPARWMTGLQCLYFERSKANDFATELRESGEVTRIVPLYADQPQGGTRIEAAHVLALLDEDEREVCCGPMAAQILGESYLEGRRGLARWLRVMLDPDSVPAPINKVLHTREQGGDNG